MPALVQKVSLDSFYEVGKFTPYREASYSNHLEVLIFLHRGHPSVEFKRSSKAKY